MPLNSTEHLSSLPHNFARTSRQRETELPFLSLPPELPAVPLAGFSQSQGDPEFPGINMTYVADKHTADVGETITFTAWILNSTSEKLTEVNLNLRSFTNSRLDSLQYTTQPEPSEITDRVLPPRRSLSLNFTYVVEAGDVQHAGLLISALQANLLSPSQGRLHSECDAWVDMELAS